MPFCVKRLPFITIEAWRFEYNTGRPHNPLEDLTPGTSSVALTAQSVRLRRKTKNPGTLSSPGFSV
jgi:hypothetical protein